MQTLRHFALILLVATFPLKAAPPKVTIVCIVDQCGQHLINKHLPFLKGGIKQLHSDSVVFTQARYPHARPATATGHTALSTGTYASKHGIVANEWFNEKGYKISACDDMNLRTSAVFKPNGGTYPKGKSARKIMAPGLAENCQDFIRLSLSLKARAAIGMGTHGAYPVWFDTRGGCFTSSKAFGDSQPFWLRSFNKLAMRLLQTQDTTEWALRYPEDHKAYQFSHATTDDYAGHHFSLPREPQPLPDTESSKPYKLFNHTPQASKMLLLLAQHAVEQMHKSAPHKPILLFISLSNLDFVGHFYGPDSIESIDMLHHIDAQIERFITSMEKQYGTTNCCWAFTADHAGMSIPEILKTKGIATAQRLDTRTLMAQVNQTIYKYFNIKNLVLSIDTPDIWFRPRKWNHLSDKKKKDIADHVSGFVSAVDGIKQAWRGDQLIDGSKGRGVDLRRHSDWFADQYYPKRSGQVVFQVEPYTYLTEFPSGTSHCTPYDYDVQVPLVFKWPGHLKAQSVDSWVSMLQVAPTLAQLLEVKAPAHANQPVLPGI